MSTKIEYALVPNPLTPEPSYSSRVLVKDTLNLEALSEAVANRSGQTRQIVISVIEALAEESLDELLRGNSVNIDGIVQLTPARTGKATSLTDDLSVDGVVGVNTRAATSLVEEFKASAQFARVTADALSPEILKISVLEGALSALRSGQVIVIDGNRLSVDPTQADEGLFLVPVGGGTALRATLYLDKGEKLLRALLPSGLVTGSSYVPRVVSRRSPGGPIHRTDATVTVTAG